MTFEEGKQRDARKTVLGPEEQEEPDRYEKREGLAAQDPINFTLFRQVERKYKNRERNLDLSEAFDLDKISSYSEFKQIDISDAFNDSTLNAKHNLENAFFYDKIRTGTAKIFMFSPIPGFLVLPGLLNEKEQIELLRDCFFNTMQSPNNSNLNYHYEIPECNLFREHYLNNNSLNLKSIQSHIEDATVDDEFLKKIRWFTIGYQYDWTTKEYLLEKKNQFPPLIEKYAKSIAGLIGCQSYTPESGVINYYQLKNTLMGHVDRSEKNMDAPLISISLGHSCVFLMGGSGRDDPVYPFILRSGDVVVFQHECRKNYHGVPRIIENSLPGHFSVTDTLEETDEEKAVKKLISTGRININIRQVF